MARFHAVFVLAWALLRTLWSRLLRRPTGIAVFHANYAADRLPAPTAEERALLPTMTGCIACGLCDLSSTQSTGAGPMDLALASSRDGSDSDAAVIGLAKLPDALLQERERWCPTGVPLVAIAKLTRQRAAAAAAMVKA